MTTVTLESLVEAARHLSSLGLSPGSSGNLSIRDGDRMIVTPTGSALSRVTADQLAILDLEGRPRGGRPPSKEAPLHLAAYLADPEARAVVHLHSPAATAIACLPPGRDGFAALPPFTPYRVMTLGDVPVLDYAAPGSDALGVAVGDAVAGGHPVMLLASHGSVTVAGSLARAMDLAEELEAGAALTLALDGRGGTLLSPAQQAELRARARG